MVGGVHVRAALLHRSCLPALIDLSRLRSGAAAAARPAMRQSAARWRVRRRRCRRSACTPPTTRGSASLCAARGADRGRRVGLARSADRPRLWQQRLAIGGARGADGRRLSRSGVGAGRADRPSASSTSTIDGARSFRRRWRPRGRNAVQLRRSPTAAPSAWPAFNGEGRSTPRYLTYLLGALAGADGERDAGHVDDVILTAARTLAPGRDRRDAALVGRAVDGR